jgi:translation elongation factor EF-4
MALHPITVHKGYSHTYTLANPPLPAHRTNDLIKMEIKINGELADPLSVICHRDNSFKIGKALAGKLKELIPRQMFRVPIQACIGQKVIASEAIAPYRCVRRGPADRGTYNSLGAAVVWALLCCLVSTDIDH